jgi:hypothetical protein
MNKFIIVSLDKDSNVLKESVDLRGLVSKGFELKSDISTVCESFDVLHENGYRVIVDSEKPFIYSEQALNEGLKDLYEKFKEKFGGSKDEFEDWYQTKLADMKEKGETIGTSIPSSIRDQSYNRSTGGTPAPVKGVTGGTSSSDYGSRRTEVTPVSNDTATGSGSEAAAKSRKMIPATKAYIRKMFIQDKASYKQLMNELIADYEKNVNEPLESLAKF